MSSTIAPPHRVVQIWLYAVCATILLMVIVGGATRLTDSGLSITEWKPIHGAIPPLGAAQWAVEFDKYRQIPEYRHINRGMSLDEFKTIYWWEWGHRQLGRFIGLFYAIPLAIFWLTGALDRRLKWLLGIGLLLGGVQGFIGWWMVSSGLVDRVDVSQYRLAVHLGLALAILAYLFTIARSLYPLDRERPFVPRAVSNLSVVTVGLIFTQILLGALVAGLDAGLTYNTWPLMDGKWIPNGLATLSPAWLNFFENITMVQFQHRAMAVFTYTFRKSGSSSCIA